MGTQSAQSSRNYKFAGKGAELPWFSNYCTGHWDLTFYGTDSQMGEINVN